MLCILFGLIINKYINLYIMKKLLLTLYLIFALIPMILIILISLNSEKLKDKFIISIKRINHKFMFYCLEKEFKKSINNDELIDIINNNDNNTKNENIEIHYRMIYDKKVPIYIYKNEDNENIALMELQKEDKINLFRYLIIEQDTDIILSKDIFTNKNKNHIKIINNKIYINLLSNMDFIKMNGFINNFGRMVENKFTLSDIISNKNTILGTLFILMINSFTMLIIMCIMHKCNNCIWSYLITSFTLLGSFITAFDCNYNKNKDIIHYFTALCLFIILPLSTYNLYDDNIIKNISLFIFIYTIIFVLYVTKYKIDKFNKLNKTNKFDFYETASANIIEGKTILIMEYIILCGLSCLLFRMIQLYK